jgi:hypothetical protein
VRVRVRRQHPASRSEAPAGELAGQECG